jgi:pyruvate formate lyase activating enzyme
VSGQRGIVFDIQHYAVHDGPGIRTLVFLKGCPLGCLWCCNPESQSAQPELRRIASRCQACLRCAGVCPVGAVRAANGAVVFDREACARCRDRVCVDACCSQALTVVGQTMDVDAVVSRVAADVEFYRNSGGGVTFSGGEPFVQHEFLRALLAACRERGIQTAVETCGHVPAGVLLEAEPLVDLFLFDLKLAEGGRHRLLTGVDNRLILDNLAALASRDPGKIVVRVPLIPGLTDDEANLLAIAAIAARHRVAAVHLQPYHPLGRDKYEQVGRSTPAEIPPLCAETVDRALAVFAAAGIHAELT